MIHFSTILDYNTLNEVSNLVSVLVLVSALSIEAFCSSTCKN